MIGSLIDFLDSSYSLEWVMLWTDVMVWGILIALLLGIRSIRRSLQSRRQWLQVFESPIAMASGLILCVYFAIALVDSVHFKIVSPQTETQTLEQFEGDDRFNLSPALEGRVFSVLDTIFVHLLERNERTYSAPFALTEYSSSVQYLANGDVEQVYLPLKYAGQHLLDINRNQLNVNTESISMGWDITEKTSSVMITSVLVVVVILLFQLYWRMHSLIFRAKPEMVGEPIHLPWKTFYITLFIIIFTLIWLYEMSQYYYVLGTDKVGQDVLYQSIKSIRTGVMIGLLTTLVMLPLALFLGISAGYFKGWIDDVIQYLYTTLNSIPGVLLIAAAVLVMQSILAQNQDWFGSTEERADLRLLFLILILGITSWTGLCRLLRAETLKLSQLEYVQSARAFGLSGFKIITKHIMPNLMHLVLIALVLDFSGLVLAEAVLSYVGVGVDPTTPSWGNMINQARLEMAREPMVWWSLLSAFTFMFILVLAANLFSDRVQRVLDPRGKN
ncbi:ABC transporter permease [Thiomicrorhabdus indica]|uniref:ABC transporter permease n=1 Tax=Thiomicrorhabdus indica TaxID=2267253 RepID=UPI001F0D6ACE|nr:ABC transporter permease [Thiomicrorhabdus indica]